MTRKLLPVLLFLLPALVCAQQQSAPTTAAATQPVVQTAIPVVLTKSLDAKKLKTGDEVTAKTSVALEGNGLTIPNGTKVIGHVTQAQARSKGDPQSALGIVFDKVELPAGKEWPIQGQIQAVAATPTPAPTVGPPLGGGTIAKQGPGDQGNTVPGPTSSLGNIQPYNPDSATNQRSQLSPSAHGVVGIRHLELDKDSVLVTTDKDLKLESGTQLLIRSEIYSSGQ